MNKQTRIWLFVGAAAIAVYFLYRYIQNRGGTESGSGALGTNLNSVAPELIGGSSGPSQGPAVDVPVTINVTDTSSTGSPDSDAFPGYPQTTSAQAITGMNAGVGSVENPATSMPSPVSAGNAAVSGNAMKSGTSRTKSPMTAQHRAAAHPAVTSQAKSNLAQSAQGATRPSVPSPSSHAAHHVSGSGTKTAAKAPAKAKPRTTRRKAK